MAIHDLTCHPSTFVTVDELAEYWNLSRRQVRKHIETGMLEAMVLGPRLHRIRTAAALELELMLKTQPAALEARRPQIHKAALNVPREAEGGRGSSGRAGSLRRPTVA